MKTPETTPQSIQHAADTLQVLLTQAALRAQGIVPHVEDGYWHNPFEEASRLLEDTPARFAVTFFDTKQTVVPQPEDLIYALGEEHYIAFKGPTKEHHVLQLSSIDQSPRFAVSALGQALPARRRYRLPGCDAYL